MRRIARATTPVALTTAMVVMLLGTPGLATADPATGPNGLAALIAEVAEANQRLQDLGAAIETEKESVNKAVADVQTARDNATSAAHDVEVTSQAVRDANAAIAAAQHRINSFAVAAYVHGPSSSYLTATSVDDVIATAAADQLLAASAQQALVNLQRARTEQVNKESAARLAKQQADQAVVDAEASHDAAVQALIDTQRTFGQQRGEIDQLVAERNAAQAKLDAARGAPTVAAGPGQPAPSAGRDRWSGGAPGRPSAGASTWDGEWDPTLPQVPSAFVSGDPIAIINTLLGYSQTSAQVTQDMGRKFMQSLGLLPTPTGYTNSPGAIPRVYGQQASEYVIRRAGSQIGVPYSWGGGNAAGPSRGIGSGSGTVGFDCSGLVLFAFAGVGIKLPHYSGSQYDLGRKIPSSQMRRGDVIFYGPGGSQHVTIYLGNGQMLEAPDVGQTVKVSPVRTSGMTPYVIRYIEY